MDLASYQRNSADVSTVLELAKIDENNLLPGTQVIYFASQLNNSRLLVLDPPILGSLKEGERLYFRGSRHDKAVLCTKNETFDIKEAETSNSLLLIPNLMFPNDNELHLDKSLLRKEITNVLNGYIEVSKIKPKIGPLIKLLHQNLYCGSEFENEVSSNIGYTTESLLNENQISHDELVQALTENDAFLVYGYWRILSFEYHFKALTFVLNLIEENSWNYHSVPVGKMFDCLKELLPSVIVNHLMNIYFHATGEIDDDDCELFELNESKVCRFLAESLLKSSSKFKLHDFSKTWQSIVPEGMTPHLNMIEDIAIIDKHQAGSELIWYFPESKLSEDIQQRFSELFKEKDKWTFEEISPYIKKLASNEQSVKVLLTKFTRSSTSNNVVYYSSRHGK